MDPSETGSVSDYGVRFVDWRPNALQEISLLDNENRQKKSLQLLQSIKSSTELLIGIHDDILKVIAVYHQLVNNDFYYLQKKMKSQQYIAPICRINVNYPRTELIYELKQYLSIKRDEYKEIHSTDDVEEDYKISTEYLFRFPLQFYEAEISASFCRLWIKGLLYILCVYNDIFIINSFNVTNQIV